MQDVTEELQLHDEEGAFQPEFVHAVEEALASSDTAQIRDLTRELHEADLADLIELLPADERVKLIAALGDDFNVEVLPELDESVRDQVIDELPNEQVAEAVSALESDDAVYLLEDLDESEQRDILAKLSVGERATLRRSLEYPDDSAGRLMRAEVIAVPPFWTVGQTIDYMREEDELPNAFSEIYTVDPAFHLIGSVELSRLLRTKRPVLIQDIAETEIRHFQVDADQEEVAREFQRFDLISAPVVDENERLVGVVTADDVVEVIQEEAEEDIHYLGGVGDESLANSVLITSRGRLAWLSVNLLTAILASLVIGLFDATIDQMVALAILMPIVASMGGNAGTQTMTVAVRALATKELGRVNASRVIKREMLVGVLNGLLFAVIMGAVALLWFGSDTLGLVIAAAMVINMLVAALSGILIPIGLDASGIDPAIASSVFVTTVTDVVGFFAFLGLAAVWLF